MLHHDGYVRSWLATDRAEQPAAAYLENDGIHARRFVPAIRQAAELVSFDTALADAGYDAEHNHRLCPEELGMRQNVIALNPHNAA
ncbi:MAG: hypothetical protein ACRYG8_30455 [Janthinobacterium lividum]